VTTLRSALPTFSNAPCPLWDIKNAVTVRQSIKSDQQLREPPTLICS